MKALSWKEPYGSLMLHGKIETRTWHTNVRGPVLICCSKTGYNLKQVFRISGERIPLLITQKLGRNYDHWCKITTAGKAIAIGTLSDCRRMTIDDVKHTYTEYHPSLWCHVYTNVIALPHPFLVKGQMGFFNVPAVQLDNPNVNLLLWYEEQVLKITL